MKIVIKTTNLAKEYLLFYKDNVFQSSESTGVFMLS